MKTSDFVGTAPRAKVGKYVVQNVSFESPASEPPEPQPIDQFRQSAGLVWAEVRLSRSALFCVGGSKCDMVGADHSFVTGRTTCSSSIFTMSLHTWMLVTMKLLVLQITRSSAAPNHPRLVHPSQIYRTKKSTIEQKNP